MPNLFQLDRELAERRLLNRILSEQAARGVAKLGREARVVILSFLIKQPQGMETVAGSSESAYEVLTKRFLGVAFVERGLKILCPEAKGIVAHAQPHGANAKSSGRGCSIALSAGTQPQRHDGGQGPLSPEAAPPPSPTIHAKSDCDSPIAPALLRINENKTTTTLQLQECQS